MLLHGVHSSLFLAFCGLVLVLNLFDAWSCLYLARAGRPRTPVLRLALGLYACASVGVVLFLSSGGGAEYLSVLHVLAALPLLLFCLAFVLWFARSPSSSR
ncbi:MAG: hypothetical protein U1F60_03735 [Planctomycetota bacterium]